MHLTFAPRGILQIDDAHIKWPNFSGRKTAYNAEGDRNFCLIIPNEEIAEELVNNGYNVKIKAPRNEGDTPNMHVQVKIKYHNSDDLRHLNPIVYLISGNRKIELDEESISMLDNIDILHIDMDLSTSNWTVNGRSGKSLYLKKMAVIQNVDRFAERYAEEEYPADDF